MPFNKAKKYGESENILESQVGLVLKTRQATKAMADSDGLLKAGSLFTSEDTYEEATPTSNPSTEGLYVEKDGVYEAATDTTVTDGTTYYKKVAGTAEGVVFEDYDLADYDQFPISVVLQGRLKADKVADDVVANKEAFAKQGLYLV